MRNCSKAGLPLPLILSMLPLSQFILLGIHKIQIIICEIYCFWWLIRFSTKLRQMLVWYTYLILSVMYLSGMRPSLPLTAPRHQSFDTCLYRMMVSPFEKFTSRDERALKSYRAWASKISDSENKNQALLNCNACKSLRSFTINYFKPYLPGLKDELTN